MLQLARVMAFICYYFLYVYYLVVWIMKCYFGKHGIVGWYFDIMTKFIAPKEKCSFPSEFVCLSIAMRCVSPLTARINRTWTLWNAYIVYYSLSDYIWFCYGEGSSLETLSHTDGDTVTYTPICDHESRGRFGP